MRPPKKPLSGGSRARVETEMPCTFTTKRGSFRAQMRQLSEGEAWIQAPRASARRGESFAMEIALIDGKAYFTVEGEVVGMEPRQDGDTYHLRFASGEGRERESVNRLLTTVLAGRGTGTRWYPRIYRRVKVLCEGVGRFEATMTNISRGGMAMQCPAHLPALNKSDELHVQFAVTGYEGPVEVVGNVANWREVRTDVYQIGLTFASMTPEDLQILDQVIEVILREEP